MNRSHFKTTICSLLLLLTSGCDGRSSDEKLLEQVSNIGFEVDVVVLQKKGEVLRNEWFPLVLYFGYANDGNMRWCVDEANRLNKQETEVTFRCVVVTKSG
jgi:hypothetical protein